jgi:hypothetical protein
MAHASQWKGVRAPLSLDGSRSSIGGMENGARTNGRTRRNGARALVVLASLAAFLAIFALWLDRQLLDTDNWTESSSQMLAAPAVRDQTAAYLTDQLYEHVDVEGEIRDALPPQAQALAGPAAGFLRDRVERRAREALARDDVQRLWEDANRAAHQALLRLLDGGGEALSTEDGRVVLDLQALLLEVEERSGIGGRAAAALPEDAAELTILESDQLAAAQDGAKIIDGLPIVLVGLSLALFAGALLLAPGRRRETLRGYGIGLVAGGAGAVVLAGWFGNALVDSVSKTASTEPTVRAVWDVYDTFLLQAATATVGYGAVMVLCAWLAGPTSWAVDTRRFAAPYLRRPVIAYGALAAVVLVVVVWWEPTPATRNPATAVLLVALLALGLEALRRRTAHEFPPVHVTHAPPYTADGQTEKPKTAV